MLKYEHMIIRIFILTKRDMKLVLKPHISIHLQTKAVALVNTYMFHPHKQKQETLSELCNQSKAISLLVTEQTKLFWSPWQNCMVFQGYLRSDEILLNFTQSGLIFAYTHITHKRPFDHPHSLPETSSASRWRAAMLCLSQRWAVIFLRYVTSWVWELGSALHFKCVRNKLMYMSVDHPASVQIAPR